MIVKSRLKFRFNLQKEDIDLTYVDMFKGLKPEVLEDLFESMEIRKFPKNKVIISEKEESKYLYVILDGLVKLYKDLGDEREAVICLRGIRDIIGNTGLFPDERLHLSVKTVSEIVTVAIPLDLMNEKMKEDFRLAQNFIKELYRNLDFCSERVKELSTEDSYSRVAKEILRFEDYYKIELRNGTSFNIGISRTDLASLVGISREMASRIMTSFVESDIIEVSGKNITLLDREKLESWEL
ncbi:MAG: Crp/Fnr family transcriptional regulator [Andreesenia angusta]|nr:Crp/Fnr family transcriptional regulator [Andreesenia angusta]